MQGSYNLSTYQGTTAGNQTGRGRTASAVGPVAKAPPTSPGAFPFDGKNHLQVDALIGAPLSDAFSVAARIEPTGGTDGVIASNAQPGRGGFDLALQGGRLVLTLSGKSGQPLAVMTKDALSSGPHDVLVSYDGSRRADGVAMYVDGRPAAATGQGQPLKGSAKGRPPVLIGARQDGSAPFVGTMGTVTFFSRALSPQEAVWVASQAGSVAANTGGGSIANSGGGGGTANAGGGVTTSGGSAGGTGQTTVGAGTSTASGAVRPRATAIVIASAAKAKGDTVAIPITVYNVNQFGDLNVTVQYPTAALKLVGFTKGAIPSGAMFDANTATPGQIRVGFVHQKGVTGSFALGRMDFQLLGQPGSKANVTATVTTATQVGTEAPIRFAVSNGVVTVLAQRVKGDWNGDGKVTSLDALAALKMSVGKLKEDLILDVDGDGRVTAKDARLLLGSAVGIGSQTGGTGSTTGGTGSTTGSTGGTTGSTGVTTGGTGSTTGGTGGTTGGTGVTTGSTGVTTGGTGVTTGGTGGTTGGTGTTSGGATGGTTTGVVGGGVGLGAGNGMTVDGTWAFAEVYAGADANLDFTQSPVWTPDSRYACFPGKGIWRVDVTDAKPSPVIPLDRQTPRTSQLMTVGKRLVYRTNVLVNGRYVPAYNAVPIQGGTPALFLRLPDDQRFQSLAALRDTPPGGLINQHVNHKWEWAIAPGDPPDPAAAKTYFIREMEFGSPMAISPDWSKAISASNMNGAAPYPTTLWALPAGKALMKFPTSRGLRSFGFSPDSTHIAAVHGQQREAPKIVIIALANPDKVITVVAGAGAANYSPPAWSPDGKYLAFMSETYGPVQFGRQQTSRKMHVVRILSPKAAGAWNALQAKLTKAKADLEDARQKMLDVSHDSSSQTVAAAEKRFQNAQRIHDDLQKQAKQFLLRQAGAAPASVAPAADLQALEKQLAEAKSQNDAAARYLMAIAHDPDEAKRKAAYDRWQVAKKKYEDLLKQVEALRAGAAAGAGASGAASAGAAGNYVATVGKPTAKPRTYAIYLYRCVLHRDPTAEEIRHCLKVLNVGKSRDREATDLLNSTEYKARKTTDRQFIRDVYQALLGRNPKRSEYAALLAELQANPDRLTFIRKVADSAEYQVIKAKL